MTARVAPLVTTTRRLRTRLEVTLPDEPDAAARRDGIRDDDAPARTGRAAWWLIQLVAGTPLSFWDSHLGVPPDEAVRLAADQPELLEGWRRAVRHQADPRWAAALFKAQADPWLLTLLPTEQGAQLIASSLDRAPDAAVARAVSAVRPPWVPEFSRVVLRRVMRMSGPAVEDAVVMLSVALDPSVAPDVEDWAAAVDDDRVRRHVRGLHHALTLRDTICKELS